MTSFVGSFARGVRMRRVTCVPDVEKDPVQILRGTAELQDGGFKYLPCTRYSAAMRCAGCRQALALIDLCSFIFLSASVFRTFFFRAPRFLSLRAHLVFISLSHLPAISASFCSFVSHPFPNWLFQNILPPLRRRVFRIVASCPKPRWPR